MLDFLFSNSSAGTLSVGSLLLILLGALGMGLGISLVYIFTHKKEGYSAGFTTTLIMLPAIVSMIILLVGNNVARAFSLAGAFSLIRFRSAPGDPKDIAYVFFTLGVGLACGIGYIGYAALFALVLCAVMILLSFLKYGRRKQIPMRLKVVLPEDMDYQGVFDDVLKEYTLSYKLNKIKTTEFGSLFELTYDVMIKEGINTKQFIDRLRCKNGNLKIVLSQKEAKDAAEF